MTNNELVPVIQADREAAADWFTLTNSLGIDHTGKAFERALRDGSYDGDRHPLVQAFARHRTRTASGEGARIAELEQALELAGNRLSSHAVDSICSGDLRSTEHSQWASEARAALSSTKAEIAIQNDREA